MKKLTQITAPLLLITAALSVSANAATPKVLSFVLASEPPQLDSTKASDSESGFILGHVMEGLTRYGKNGETVPGMAESWEINDKGATFRIRENAKWSDGKPVQAQDFIYAWRTALDPKTASEYAFILYPVKNAEAINAGKLPLERLGVEAPDSLTLKVLFEKPCGYFLGLTAFPTYFPIREDFHKQKKDRYAADAGDLLFNGPFALTSWVHGASLKMEKNPHYWNSTQTKLDAISIPYITSDNNARFNFFKDKKVDVLAGLGKDDLSKAQKERFRMKSFSDGSFFYLSFNFREDRPTRNKNLRKAIAAVFDPAEYVSKVVGIPGTRLGLGIIPVWVRGVNELFRTEFPIVQRQPDLKKAREYLEAAKTELGGSIPPIMWLTGDTPMASREAEYFQSQLKRVLDLDLRIDKQIFKQRLAKMTSGQFDIVAAGWGPDFADPMTFAELFTSWNENNRGKWTHKEYDRLIRAAQSTADNVVRMKAMAEAEKIALEELVVLPTYERTVIFTTAPQIKSVARHTIGPDPDFTGAEIAIPELQ
ncbi:MAG: hypothetical protein A2X94_13010 [Bdellovibrionales bacterium GWB1_55_8]|nr:MAG: hypothetical protein A2X94_13010 [Bdellovibrionales bacterium GWB1_55_8]